MHSIDIFIQNYFSLTRTPLLTEFYYLVTTMFNFSLLFVLLVLCIAFLIYSIRGLKYVVLFLFSLVLTGGGVYFLKLVFNVTRPADPVISAFGSSFPSYHATMATVFFIMLMYIFHEILTSWKGKVFDLFCIVSVILVSFSRLYLGVHWLSDIFGGVFLGLMISFVLVRGFKRIVLE